MKRHSPIALAAAALLAACAGPRTLPGDDQPTLASLPSRPTETHPDAPDAHRQNKGDGRQRHRELGDSAAALVSPQH